MTDTSPPLSSAFKPASGGWTFAPLIAALGPWVGTWYGKQYLVRDDQKAEIIDMVARWRRAVMAVCLVYAILCGAAAIFALGTLFGLWTFDTLPRWPFTQLGGGLLAAILALPFPAMLAIYAIAMRRKLIGVSEAAERITQAEVLAKEAARQTRPRIKAQLGICVLFMCLAFAWLPQSLQGGRYGAALGWSAMVLAFACLSYYWIRLLRLKRSTDDSARPDG